MTQLTDQIDPNLSPLIRENQEKAEIAKSTFWVALLRIFFLFIPIVIIGGVDFGLWLWFFFLLTSNIWFASGIAFVGLSAAYVKGRNTTIAIVMLIAVGSLAFAAALSSWQEVQYWIDLAREQFGSSKTLPNQNIWYWKYSYIVAFTLIPMTITWVLGSLIVTIENNIRDISRYGAPAFKFSRLERETIRCQKKFLDKQATVNSNYDQAETIILSPISKIIESYEIGLAKFIRLRDALADGRISSLAVGGLTLAECDARINIAESQLKSLNAEIRLIIEKSRARLK